MGVLVLTINRCARVFDDLANTTVPQRTSPARRGLAFRSSSGRHGNTTLTPVFGSHPKMAKITPFSDWLGRDWMVGNLSKSGFSGPTRSFSCIRNVARRRCGRGQHTAWLPCVSGESVSGTLSKSESLRMELVKLHPRHSGGDRGHRTTKLNKKKAQPLLCLF